MPALLVAGTGKVSTKAALALIKDHKEIYSEDEELALGLVLGSDLKSVAWGLLDHLDDISPDAVALFGVTGAVVDDDILENVDHASFTDNPNARAIELLEEGDVLLLAFDENDEESSIEAIKLAQSKGAKILDLSDGLLELEWTEDEPTEAAVTTILAPEDTDSYDEDDEDVETIKKSFDDGEKSVTRAPVPDGEETLMEVLEKPTRTRRTKAQIEADAAEEKGQPEPDADYYQTAWNAGYAAAREDLLKFLGGAFVQ